MLWGLLSSIACEVPSILVIREILNLSQKDTVPVELLGRSAGLPLNKPSFACKEVLDLTRDERGNAVIEFDLVKVVVSFEVLGLLYAMIYSLEAAEDDRGSERANRH
jgi:hypothetical protein